MVKQILQDVVPPERSIRTIPLPERRRRKSTASAEKESVETEVVADKISVSNPPKKRSNKKRRFFTRLSFLLVIIIVSYLGLSVLMGGTVLTLVPRNINVSVNSTFNSKLSSEELRHETVTLNKEESVLVPAAGKKEVSEYASGTIVIYNNYSTASQRLIKNTRFESPDGKIFRLRESVSVPGMTKNGSAGVPGTLEVTVYADEAGDKFNIPIVDWTIPGFRSDASRYSQLYARSKTAMSGGFIGMVNFAEEADIKAAEDSLKTKLRGEIVKDMSAAIPADFTFFSDAAKFMFEVKSEDAGAEGVKVTTNASATAVIFERNILGRAVAMKTIEDYAGDDVYISNPSEIDFSFVGDSVSRAGSDSVDFSLKGDANIVYDIPVETIRSEILGLKKTEATEVLNKYFSIKTWNLLVSPIWKTSVSSTDADIEVVVEGSSIDPI